MYDFRAESVMARLLQHCYVDRKKVTVQWWNGISKVLGTTLTDHCNNVIKQFTIVLKVCVKTSGVHVMSNYILTNPNC